MEAWIPGAALGLLGLLGSGAGWLFGWKENNAKTETKLEGEQGSFERRLIDLRDDIKSERTGLEQDITELRSDLKANMAEMRTTASAIAAMQERQGVVNEVTAKTLESIVAKLDRHDEVIHDHTATLRLLTALVTERRRDP
jgi:hypothetical protein